MAWDIWGWKAKIWCWEGNYRERTDGKFHTTKGLGERRKGLDGRTLTIVGDMEGFAF